MAVWRMVRRRASDIETAIGRHTLRTTGITDHLRNGGRIEVAQRMAGRSNAKTTDPYDRCNGAVSLDEMERIGFDLVLQGIARRCLSDIIGSMETLMDGHLSASSAARSMRRQSK
jgi:hypothetical protein